MKTLQALAVLVTGMATFAATAGTITYYHNDLAGSPVAATNASGQVIWRESYRPYGERTTNSAASTDNKIWFTSRRQDAETGLIYMGARYYDPLIGRFISTTKARTKTQRTANRARRTENLRLYQMRNAAVKQKAERRNGRSRERWRMQTGISII